MSRIRICTWPGCKTRLSEYNPKDTCYIHTEDFTADTRRGATHRMSDRFVNNVPGAYSEDDVSDEEGTDT